MAQSHHPRAMTALPTTSRKGFLAGAAVGAGTLLSACGEDSPAPNAGAGARDVAVLNRALEREHASVALYLAGLGQTRGPARATMKRLLEQERDHVRGLTEAIRDLGGTPRRSLSLAAYRAELGVDRVRDDAFMLLAARVENDTIASYLAHLPELSDGRLRQTAAAIMANEAEHVAMLTGIRDPGRPVTQVPAAFVGSAP